MTESFKNNVDRAPQAEDMPGRDFEQYRSKFHAFYSAVASDHRESVRQHKGHGLDHDVTVAQLAAQIVPDSRTAEKAWCAGMLHSTDRYAAIAKVSEGPNEVGEEVMQNLKYLPLDYFSGEDLAEIYAAACRHDELNQGDQEEVQMALMDADRLVNLMSSVVIRAGQFQAQLPAFEPEFLNGTPNPASTYLSPKSVLDDLRGNIIAYVPQLRLPKAKEMGEKLIAKLEEFIKDVENDPQLAIVITASQSHPAIPAFEFGYLQGQPNPESTLDNPKSVLDELRLKELSQDLRTKVDRFIDLVEADCRTLGLVGIRI